MMIMMTIQKINLFGRRQKSKFRKYKDNKKTVGNYLQSFLFFSGLFFILGCQSNPIKPEKLLPSQLTASHVAANPSYGQMAESRVHVVIVEQWHLSPQDNTKALGNDPNLVRRLGQYQNQMAIYQQVSQWIDSGVIKSVVAEGCEGEMDQNFMTRFNGWTLADLNMMSDLGQGIDHVQTHVGLKLKSRFKEKLPVLCGDNLNAISEQQLVLSDMRGLTGFRIRIEQYASDPERRQSYLKSLRKVLKMSEESTEQDVLTNLDQQLKESSKKFDELLVKRNSFFTKAISSATKPTVVIVGQLHSDDLKKQLNQSGLQSVVFTPVGMPAKN